MRLLACKTNKPKFRIGLIAYTMIPTLDNLRNFFFTPTTEVLSFFQQLREVP